MAEALLRRDVARVGVAATVSSTGTIAAGRPASENAVEALAELGLDISGHRSRVLTAEQVAGADLVLAMAREHVREAAVADPSAYGRTFTLKELVRRADEHGRPGTGETLDDWLARLHRGRAAASHLGSSAGDDVADPIGQRLAVYERTAAELAALTARLADLLWCLAPAVPSDPRPLPEETP